MIGLILYFIMSLFKADQITLCQGNVIDGLTHVMPVGENYLVLSDHLYFIDDSCDGPVYIFKNGIEPYNG